MLLTLKDASLAYGLRALLDHAELQIDAGDRIALVGRNGTGKSSLMKVIAGLEKLDDGLLQMTQGVRICYVPQEPVFEPGHSVFEAVRTWLSCAKPLAVHNAIEKTIRTSLVVMSTSYDFNPGHSSDSERAIAATRRFTIPA
jgi:ATP-binding cassette subfamily F protein uup